MLLHVYNFVINYTGELPFDVPLYKVFPYFVFSQ